MEEGDWKREEEKESSSMTVDDEKRLSMKGDSLKGSMKE